MRIFILVPILFLAACSGAKPCDSASCSGCCTAAGACEGGQTNAACGSGGYLCSTCGVGLTCQLNTCVPFNNATGGGSSSTGGGSATGGGGSSTGGGSATGGGGSSTGGGSATGGGGPSCDGCLLPAGGCLPAAVTSATNCGLGGAACISCASGRMCIGGACAVPPAMTTVGSPCVDQSDCSALGPTAICKDTTSSGNGLYRDGYCTLDCATNMNICPSGSLCVGAGSNSGESDVFCWDRCGGANGTCRAGYGCYAIASGTTACWISPTPPRLDPADKVGNACTSNSQCANPPTNGGVCLSNEFGFDWGTTGGYCSRTACQANGDCSADGGALCVGFSGGDAACVKRCADSRDGGQSDCRSGYACRPYAAGTPDGGSSPSTDGFCLPPSP